MPNKLLFFSITEEWTAEQINEFLEDVEQVTPEEVGALAVRGEIEAMSAEELNEIAETMKEAANE
jgi:hypothetical protein